MRRRSFLALATASLVAPATAQEDRLARALRDVLERYGIPGVTAALVLPDGAVISGAAGFADVEAGRAMTPETPMLAASIGKSFVAATLLALEDEGRLSRDDLLSAHLGDRPWFGTLPNADSLTLGQLLHHTSGIPDYVHLREFQESWARLTGDGSAFDAERLLAFVARRAPLFEAGRGWAYSDTGYVLLGLVIEEVTGEGWHDAVRTRLLGPLALGATFPSDRPDLPGLAVGYTDPANRFGLPARTSDVEGHLLWNPAVEAAGGGFASTSADLARWGHLLFGGAAMPGPYLDRLIDGVAVDPDAPGIRYGAGVAIYADTPRGPVYGHGGWIPGYVSSLRHYAAHGVSVAFQINSDIGIADDASDLVPALEAALADLAITLKNERR
ncbi:serine hydrolase domain-containing protein [Jannaschia seohaensis]|uniref:D-alanyl-D-alanine carboxypeptidase n=1 Tax=Jannaschia seohaensis TaxID=475081 RepID=A0A2Y9APT4_9RHOB|nr:serine hydrolase domain-containing protein [Jannaschia seohaensis]PWJ20314.1 D-alanyl-D-alanine carboxypeptidase [Jannaschia seohaensis]SSA44349.1 D-alanyl-D-alanine carboxypeptidase [Jannaschia seohaensis]